MVFCGFTGGRREKISPNYLSVKNPSTEIREKKEREEGRKKKPERKREQRKRGERERRD